jgi:hypothetical protein
MHFPFQPHSLTVSQPHSLTAFPNDCNALPRCIPAPRGVGEARAAGADGASRVPVPAQARPARDYAGTGASALGRATRRARPLTDAAPASDAPALRFQGAAPRRVKPLPSPGLRRPVPCGPSSTPCGGRLAVGVREYTPPLCSRLFPRPPSPPFRPVPRRLQPPPAVASPVGRGPIPSNCYALPRCIFRRVFCRAGDSCNAASRLYSARRRPQRRTGPPSRPSLRCAPSRDYTGTGAERPWPHTAGIAAFHGGPLRHPA